MSLFAIRDDDTSFFTNPEDLESVYKSYWGKVPISLATIPFSGPEHRDRSFSPTCSPDSENPLGANKNLVDWLKNKNKNGQIDIMLHGYSHRYRRINGQWVGEYGWKPQEQLAEETRRGKEYLESLLETNIKVFVPPSNTISKYGIQAIRSENLNLSGVMGRGLDRPFTLDYMQAYAKRWAWRLRHGDAYPFPLRYGGHSELRAYTLTPRSDEDGLCRSLRYCASINAPFVLATHYWEFNDFPNMHSSMARLISLAENLDMKFVNLSSCFGE